MLLDGGHVRRPHRPRAAGVPRPPAAAQINAQSRPDPDGQRRPRRPVSAGVGAAGVAVGLVILQPVFLGIVVLALRPGVAPRAAGVPVDLPLHPPPRPAVTAGGRTCRWSSSGSSTPRRCGPSTSVCRCGSATTQLYERAHRPTPGRTCGSGRGSAWPARRRPRLLTGLTVAALAWYATSGRTLPRRGRRRHRRPAAARATAPVVAEQPRQPLRELARSSRTSPGSSPILAGSRCAADRRCRRPTDPSEIVADRRHLPLPELARRRALHEVVAHRSGAARSSPWSARTGRARRRWPRSSPGCSVRPASAA